MLVWILIGIVVIVVIGVGLVAMTRASRPRPVAPLPESAPKPDLGGKVGLEKLECQECGAVLEQDSITIKEGLTFISCPYCNSSYQMFEGDNTSL